VQVLNGYQIDDNRERLDLALVHSWLTTSYWSPGVSREIVDRAAQGSSLVVGAYREGQQVGYLRVVSDRATFGWLCDVFVDEAHRGNGIARAMVRFALDHPEHQGFRRWILASRDAQNVYAPLGFDPIPNPDKWMIHIPDPSAQPNI
jgi:GNAT superfamily N-acetyltransferase